VSHLKYGVSHKFAAIGELGYLVKCTEMWKGWERNGLKKEGDEGTKG
jgi:hypothetical protein